MKVSRTTRILILGVVLATLAVPGAWADASRTDGSQPVVRGTCPTGSCGMLPPNTITGTLGSCGDWPSCTSGTQTGRLNRNGVASSCAAPKTCNQFNTTPGYAYDAYTINNGTGLTACVTATLNVITQTNCNLQMNAYLNTYDPANICEPQSDYLADPGLSSGIPPSPLEFCFEVPDGNNLILVVHTTNVGEIGCDYQIVLTGDCIPVELMSITVEDN